MKTRAAIATPRNSRLKITKESQLFRLRDELLLIPVNAHVEYRKRLAGGADKNITHPRINQSKAGQKRMSAQKIAYKLWRIHAIASS